MVAATEKQWQARKEFLAAFHALPFAQQVAIAWHLRGLPAEHAPQVSRKPSELGPLTIMRLPLRGPTVVFRGDPRHVTFEEQARQDMSDRRRFELPYDPYIEIWACERERCPGDEPEVHGWPLLNENLDGCDEIEKLLGEIVDAMEGPDERLVLGPVSAAWLYRRLEPGSKRHERRIVGEWPKSHPDFSLDRFENFRWPASEEKVRESIFSFRLLRHLP